MEIGRKAQNKSNNIEKEIFKLKSFYRVKGRRKNHSHNPKLSSIEKDSTMSAGKMSMTLRRGFRS